MTLCLIRISRRFTSLSQFEPVSSPFVLSIWFAIRISTAANEQLNTSIQIPRARDKTYEVTNPFRPPYARVVSLIMCCSTYDIRALLRSSKWLAACLQCHVLSYTDQSPSQPTPYPDNWASQDLYRPFRIAVSNHEILIHTQRHFIFQVAKGRSAIFFSSENNGIFFTRKCLLQVAGITQDDEVFYYYIFFSVVWVLAIRVLYITHGIMKLHLMTLCWRLRKLILFLYFTVSKSYDEFWKLKRAVELKLQRVTI